MTRETDVKFPDKVCVGIFFSSICVPVSRGRFSLVHILYAHPLGIVSRSMNAIRASQKLGGWGDGGLWVKKVPNHLLDT